MPLTDVQRDELQQRLEKERARLLRRLRRFGEEMGDRESSGFSQHMAEAASDLTERETAFLMASEEGRRLVELDRALGRLRYEPASYGTCRVCGDPIAFERLEALPHTDVCIECKREEESGGGSRV